LVNAKNAVLFNKDEDTVQSDVNTAPRRRRLHQSRRQIESHRLTQGQEIDERSPQSLSPPIEEHQYTHLHFARW
jgi:hypothetical protein